MKLIEELVAKSKIQRQRGCSLPLILDKREELDLAQVIHREFGGVSRTADLIQREVGQRGIRNGPAGSISLIELNLPHLATELHGVASMHPRRIVDVREGCAGRDFVLIRIELGKAGDG